MLNLKKVTAVTGLWLYEDPILEIPVTIGTCPITNETYQVANQSGRSIIHPSAPTEDLIASAPSESIVVSGNNSVYHNNFECTNDSKFITQQSRQHMKKQCKRTHRMVTDFLQGIPHTAVPHHIRMNIFIKDCKLCDFAFVNVF